MFFLWGFTQMKNKPFELINPLTPVGDQDRISSYYICQYNIMQTSDEIKEKYQ